MFMKLYLQIFFLPFGINSVLVNVEMTKIN